MPQAWVGLRRGATAPSWGLSPSTGGPRLYANPKTGLLPPRLLKKAVHVVQVPQNVYLRDTALSRDGGVPRRPEALV